MRNIRTLLALLTVGVLTAACPAGDQLPYPTKDSGLGVDGQTEYFWMDNDRVLFGAYDLKEHEKARTSIIDTSGLYVWNTATNTVARHADWKGYQRVLCFHDGNVYYSSDKDVFWGGAFGSETIVKLGEEASIKATNKACYDYPKVRQDKNYDRIIYDLRPQDGYILVADNSIPGMVIQSVDNGNNRVKLFRPSQEDSIDLPILGKELGSYGAWPFWFTYSEYAGRYVLVPSEWRSHDRFSEHYSNVPEGMSMPIYLISPDGKVDTIPIPRESFPAAHVVPTRAGVWWVSSESGRGGSFRGGTWLWHDGKIVKVADDVLYGVASPNGCKLVYGAKVDGQEEVAKVVDFCGSSSVTDKK